MPIQDDISWFKQQFQQDIQAAIGNTPFSIELIIAIALQETGYLWRNIYKRETVAKTLELCVGDTISAPNRTAFPKDKSELLSKPKGDEMFQIAREALESIAPYNNDFNKAAKKPEKFCHGFGIFQYDIQFFLENPNFFLEKRWYEFDECLKICVEELNEKLVKTYGSNKSDLTDREMVYVAIAYNRGRADLDRDFKQGYKDSSGKYYGEYIWEYLQLAKSNNVIPSVNPKQYEVNARSVLRVRSGPGTDFDVIDRLPFGRRVSVGKRQGEWIEIDLEGDGVIDGFVFASYLKPV
ncbi:SH3 domain-containing protein [Nostoc sp. 'Peltigera membranacea cyanobiont' N6]|uniref:SH3 domain-containing protein n=1 Tax=Nostoc sp. 'Peltigera membranacea cyanobiont' N6 TaxID=1261031 RepID=UPI000CF33F19|nr:SH3 domain-containing protein [Nostoc sp. 'Peltigera membranacea cyanobiont' N6]AVH68504.1 SH3 domain-containing protein [Nostoc sp. 'Peltigera membranacea cyanobiont' N6]